MMDSKIAAVGKLCRAGMFFMLSLMLLFAGGCKKKNNNPVNSNNSSTSEVSFTVNGGDYSNRDINLTSGSTSGAFYITDKNATLASINGKSGSNDVSVRFLFPGKNSGSFSWDTTSISGFAFTIGGVTFADIPGQGVTKVTQYGDVGSTIKGTFSGEVFGFSGTAVDTLHISSGTFTLVREKDQSTNSGKTY